MWPGSDVSCVACFWLWMVGGCKVRCLYSVCVVVVVADVEVAFVVVAVGYGTVEVVCCVVECWRKVVLPVKDVYVGMWRS